MPPLLLQAKVPEKLRKLLNASPGRGPDTQSRGRPTPGAHGEAPPGLTPLPDSISGTPRAAQAPTATAHVRLAGVAPRATPDVPEDAPTAGATGSRDTDRNTPGLPHPPRHRPAGTSPPVTTLLEQCCHLNGRADEADSWDQESPQATDQAGSQNNSLLTGSALLGHGPSLSHHLKQGSQKSRGEAEAPQRCGPEAVDQTQGASHTHLEHAVLPEAWTPQALGPASLTSPAHNPDQLTQAVSGSPQWETEPGDQDKGGAPYAAQLQREKATCRAWNGPHVQHRAAG